MSVQATNPRYLQKLPEYPGRAALEARVGPFFEPVARNVAGRIVQRMLGFWVLWHALGGSVADVEAARIISRRGIYAQRAEFLEVFGVDVDEYQPMIAGLIREAERDRGRQR